MNKMRGFWVILAIFGFFVYMVSMGLVSAELEDIQKTAQTISDVSSTDNPSGYLLGKIGEFIMNSWFGSLITSLGKALAYLNPAFMLVFGVNFGWTALFFLTLAIYAILVFFAYNVLSLTKSYIHYEQDLFGIDSERLVYWKGGLFASFVVILSFIKVPKIIASYAVLAMTNKYWNVGDSLSGILVTFVVIILAIVVIVILSMYLRRIDKDLWESNREKKLRDVEAGVEIALESEEEREEEEEAEAESVAKGESSGLSKEDRKTLRKAKELAETFEEVTKRR